MIFLLGLHFFISRIYFTNSIHSIHILYNFSEIISELTDIVKEQLKFNKESSTQKHIQSFLLNNDIKLFLDEKFKTKLFNF